jgi:DNA-binding Lrp family transcriptional regulator
MVIELDQKDKLILYLLDGNSKQPLSKIAKQVKLSRESVLYRLNSYFDNNIIRNYLPIIDTGAFEYTHYKVFLKLSNINSEKEKEFIDFLKSNSNVSWIGSIEGTYSLKYVIRAKSTLELSKILNDINKDYWKYIKKMDFATIIAGHHFSRDYLIKDLNKNKSLVKKDIITWTEARIANKLDNIDYLILNELSKNVRKSSTDIAKLVKTSPDTVILRIKKMEKLKVIQNYTIWPNVNNLIGQYYKILLTFNKSDDILEKKLLQYCNADSNIVYLVKTFGNWQYEIDIEVKSPEDMRELMRKFSTHFEESLLEYDVLNVYKEHKFKFFDIVYLKRKKQVRINRGIIEYI